jgi:alanyl-tRNA synthetase
MVKYSQMTSQEIRAKFLAFFEKKGHAIIPSAPLVPENDPSVLFNTAGMQPLVPYLLGQKHPLGKRLANAQKCVRTVDIDDIGDNTHATFFEMLGNWSLGDYFKKEAIEWSYELLTEEFGLDPKRLYITVFAGDENAPRDMEAVEIWKSVGVPENRIYFLPAKNNWWAAGDNGPCGPDSEMFYDVTPNGLGNMTHDEYVAADDRRDVVEIWNDVFMEYEKKDGKVVGKLASKNIDTGSGLERVTMVIQGKDNIYDTDLLKPIVDKIQSLSSSKNQVSERIIADHIRTAVFMISDGVVPSNTDQGYILRRLLRRAIRHADILGMGSLSQLIDTVISIYKGVYDLKINDQISLEEEKFRKTLKDGIKQFEKGEDPFILFSTYGFPIELTLELAKEKAIEIDLEDFNKKMLAHQDISRAGSQQKFKGGLADTSEQSVRYHTATHLLHYALRKVLGDHVQQKGSNITPERLRFDFAHPTKMTDEEKKKVEDIVNEKIQQAITVENKIMPKEEAVKIGALHFFNEKYPDQVSVYFIGDSIEFCGGPHVKNTKELGIFKIAKEEAVSAGVRRIKAVLS